MKKVLITMVVLASMVAGAMVFSSFATPKTNDESVCSQIKTAIPSYWEGTARVIPSCGLSIQIKVYQTEGQCNSYYAVVSKDNSETWVKANPTYDSSLTGTADTARNNKNYYNYYVTYNNHDYYFRM